MRAQQRDKLFLGWNQAKKTDNTLVQVSTTIMEIKNIQPTVQLNG